MVMKYWVLGREEKKENGMFQMRYPQVLRSVYVCIGGKWMDELREVYLKAPLKHFIECLASRETFTLEIGDRKNGNIHLKAISTEMIVVVEVVN